MHHITFLKSEKFWILAQNILDTDLCYWIRVNIHITVGKDIYNQRELCKAFLTLQLFIKLGSEYTDIYELDNSIFLHVWNIS